MCYDETIQKSMEFIKEHIDENLTAERIAEYAGYSLFHFCRIFALSVGVPLMQYVRQYRLALARHKLGGADKVLDVALQYGFESASGFSKSFRKEFGYSPTSYRVRMRGADDSFLLDIGEVIQPPVIRQEKEWKVAGYGMDTNLTDTFAKDAAAYWDTYHGADLETKMYDVLQPPKHGEVGLCLPGKGGKAVYLFGVIVEDFSKMIPGMTAAVVPAATYAVFTTPPVNNTATAATYDKDPLSIAVKESWRYIFSTWFPASRYCLAEEKYAFEFYDERCHGLENAVAEIYVPIEKES